MPTNLSIITIFITVNFKTHTQAYKYIFQLQIPLFLQLFPLIIKTILINNKYPHSIPNFPSSAII